MINCIHVYTAKLVHCAHVHVCQACAEGSALEEAEKRWERNTVTSTDERCMRPSQLQQ